MEKGTERCETLEIWTFFYKVGGGLKHFKLQHFGDQTKENV